MEKCLRVFSGVHTLWDRYLVWILCKIRNESPCIFPLGINVRPPVSYRLLRMDSLSQNHSQKNIKTSRPTKRMFKKNPRSLWQRGF